MRAVPPLLTRNCLRDTAARRVRVLRSVGNGTRGRSRGERQRELHADAILLRRALSNLLSNSLRHTPANGIVRITIQDRNESGTDIVVSDNGSDVARYRPRKGRRGYRIGASNRKVDHDFAF